MSKKPTKSQRRGSQMCTRGAWIHMDGESPTWNYGWDLKLNLTYQVHKAHFAVPGSPGTACSPVSPCVPKYLCRPACQTQGDQTAVTLPTTTAKTCHNPVLSHILLASGHNLMQLSPSLLHSRKTQMFSLPASIHNAQRQEARQLCWSKASCINSLLFPVTDSLVRTQHSQTLWS